MKYETPVPQEVFTHFYAISSIPRCSGKEKAVSDYIKNWGLNLGLSVRQDEENNLILKKKGSKGYESSKPIIIQGHLDMVGDKARCSNHQFDCDPLHLVVEGDRLRADNTTLGGDNGIAVAYALALLESTDIPHPPLEILFTTNEETGMTGARSVKRSDFAAETLINLDAEEEGVFLVSCAGGVRVNILQNIEREEPTGTEFLISVGGLKGGHSGMEIHKERANANKVLSSTLFSLYRQLTFRIIEFSGGSKTNVIPREASARIQIDKDSSKMLYKKLSILEETFKKEFRSTDAGIRLNIEPSTAVHKPFTQFDTERFLHIAMLFPNGVQTNSTEIPGLVETSCNLGVISTQADRVIFSSSIRSSVSSRKWKVVDQLTSLSAITGTQLEVLADYPPWEYKPSSKIREVFMEAYRSLYGKEPSVTAIHAGLECGLFTETLGDLDMISTGPNLYDVHSPNESLSISSVGRTWEFLKEVLKRLK